MKGMMAPKLFWIANAELALTIGLWGIGVLPWGLALLVAPMIWVAITESSRPLEEYLRERG